MKVLKPLVIFLVLLIVISFIVGFTLETIVVQFSYSSTLSYYYVLEWLVIS